MGTYLVGYDVLQSYMHSFLHGKFSDRIFIEDARLQELLQRYAVGGDMCRKKVLPALSDTEKQRMLSLVKPIPSLHAYLISIDGGGMKAPAEVTNFLLSLASPSPVCSYIHPNSEVWNLMEDLINGELLKQDPLKWHALHTYVPVLFEVLEKHSGLSAPKDMRPLLSQLWEYAFLPFNHPCSQESCSSEDIHVEEDDLAFFPSLQKIKNRNIYPVDGEKRRKKKCTKRYPGHPSLLPGVFTLYCPHAPRVVIYDNACGLHANCLNRDPDFFRDTEFYVDRLHGDNPSACSIGYCLAVYPEFQTLNSQVNEQGNAGIKRIKDQLSYMTADNFMTYTKFYLWNKNSRKKANV